MKIAITGGGSGGHITPLLAVADELKKLEPNSSISFIGQKGEKLIGLVSNHDTVDSVYSIRAGKFRRYHGEGLISHLLDIKTISKNIRDFFYVIIGTFQSLRLLGKIRPDVIFIKGGFVGVPVGISARILKIPFVTHDSDAIPGLANRIIGRWAKMNAVALPKELYNYPPEKTVTVGVPIGNKFIKVNDDLQTQYKNELGLNQDSLALLITGGGMGAERLNNAFVEVAPELLDKFKNLHIFHIAGNKHEDEVRNKYNNKINDESFRKRVTVKALVDNFFVYSGASDLIIARAGATNLAEFAAQAKACIIVPNPNLTGGHQLKNALFLQDKSAIEIIDDETLQSDPSKIRDLTTALLSNESKRKQLGQNLSLFTNSNSASELAKLIIKSSAA